MQTPPIRVIITGATGMVGEGVLHECLSSPAVSAVLLVSRKPSGLVHPKLSERLVADFMQLDATEAGMAGYEACFFCLGVSSVGISKALYEQRTHDLTMHFARELLKQNQNMVFCYVSGAGTDSSEKKAAHWARVKGKTENDLQKLPFKRVYAFRPGIMKPTPGLKNTLPFYKWMGWLIPVVRLFSHNAVIRLSDLGRAMIQAATRGEEKNIIEVPDILRLSRQA